MSLEETATEQLKQAAAPVQGTELAPAGKVHAVVTAHVEPVTRFSAGDLREREPEQAFGVALELTLEQQVDFCITVHEGPARLPAGTDEMGGEYAMRADLQRRLSRAFQEAPEAIGRWAAQEPGSYRRLMPGAAGFLRNPGCVGYEYTCGNCAGAGRITCGGCGGVGDLPCFSCHGLGKIDCYSCHGSKKLACSGCNGRGSWTEYVTTQVWNPATNSYVSDTRSEFRVCYTCGGNGHSTCHSCDYAGKIQCIGCAGRGRVLCGGCAGSGRVNCPSCLASGIRHEWGTIESSVAAGESLSVSTPDEALERLVRTRVPVDALPAHGELLDVLNEVDGTRLCTRHRMRLDVRRACIEAQGREFVIHGLGPEPRVYSFENIAGHMLEADLVALEAKVAASSGWKPTGGADLLDATAEFLRSELNMLVAERVADLKAKPQEAAEQVERHFHGMVTADYVTRATTALRTALSRLWGAAIARPALKLCGAVAVTAGVMYGFSWPGPGAAPAVFWSVAGAAGVWAGLEWFTRRRIGTRFDPEFARRVMAQLRADGGFRRWRIGVAAAAACAAWLGATVTEQLPFVRSYHAQKQELARAGFVLAGWSQQPVADFRQRSYPPRAWLHERAEDGDTRAQLVLAWQLLLGASGMPKDVDAARRWIDRAQATASRDPLWSAAKALYDVNQEVTPDVIRAAADDLGRAADAGVVEARFWQARIYLAENSPMYDLRRGMQLLQQAADRRHTRAAFQLGERYAKGEGVRRDPLAARRYLTQAAADGLPEAREALAALR
jgi:hypothetical protein